MKMRIKLNSNEKNYINGMTITTPQGKQMKLKWKVDTIRKGEIIADNVEIEDSKGNTYPLHDTLVSFVENGTVQSAQIYNVDRKQKNEYSKQKDKELFSKIELDRNTGKFDEREQGKDYEEGYAR